MSNKIKPGDPIVFTKGSSIVRGKVLITHYTHLVVSCGRDVQVLSFDSKKEMRQYV